VSALPEVKDWHRYAVRLENPGKPVIVWYHEWARSGEEAIAAVASREGIPSSLLIAPSYESEFMALPGSAWDLARKVLASVDVGRDEEPSACTWTEDADGIWWAACRLTRATKAHEFTVGGPADNDHRFCPYCGKALEAVPFVDCDISDHEADCACSACVAARAEEAA